MWSAAQALKIPLLRPHLQSVGYDFTHGANFAFSGVTTQNNSYSSKVSPPFYFWIQTKQFQYFKERTLALWNQSRKGKNSEIEILCSTFRTWPVFNFAIHLKCVHVELHRDRKAIESLNYILTFDAGHILRSSLKLSTKPKYFQSGLYIINFGANDFVVPLMILGQTLEQVQSNISSIANAMVANTEVRQTFLSRFL